MNIIEWIKTTKCPDCGETVIVEERIEFFMDKKSGETRVFKCGKTVENHYNKWDDFHYACKKSPAYLSFLEKKKQFIEKLRNFLIEQKANKSLIDDLTSHIEYHCMTNEQLEEEPPAKIGKPSCKR